MLEAFYSSPKVRASIKPLIYIGLSLAAGFANYLFYPLAKHMLGIERFSVIVVFTSIVAVFGAILIAQQLYTIAHFALATPSEQLNTMMGLRTKAVRIGVVLSVGYLALGVPIFRALNIHDMVSFWLILVLLWVLAAANMVASYWQAKTHFLKLGIFMLTTSIIQLAVTYALLKHNAQAYNAVLGLVLGQVATMIFVLLYFGDVRHFIIKRKTKDSSQQGSINELLKITVAVFLLYLFLNFDVFVTKRYLSIGNAGLYGTFSTIMKVMFFVVTPTVGVFLPKLAGLKQVQFRKQLTTLGGLMIGGTVLMWIIVASFYRYIFHLIYGLQPGALVGLRFLMLPMLVGEALTYAAVTILIVRKQYRLATIAAAVAVTMATLTAAIVTKNLRLGPLSVCAGSASVAVLLGTAYFIRKKD